MPLRVVGMMSAMGTHHVAGGRPAQGGKLRVAPSRLPGRMRPNGWSSDVTRDPGCLEGANSASRARWRTGAANIRNWPESGVSPLSEKGWLPSRDHQPHDDGSRCRFRVRRGVGCLLFPRPELEEECDHHEPDAEGDPLRVSRVIGTFMAGRAAVGDAPRRLRFKASTANTRPPFIGITGRRLNVPKTG